MPAFLSRLRPLALVTALFCTGARPASGVIFLGTDVPTHNISTPGDNSGWQYEGRFMSFLGTPIAPLYFITAHHINGNVGEPFVFNGESYKTVATYTDPNTDLAIWKVDHAFPSYAPLYLRADEVGQLLTVIGRGTQRGGAVTLNGTLKGWQWGGADSVPRWGRNVVAGLYPGTSPFYYLRAAFDSPGVPEEATLSVGDSGGGVFILEDGLWKLAAINYGVDDLYTAPGSGEFVAAIFDSSGYYQQNNDGSFSAATQPTSFYSTRISARLDWIQSITQTDPTVLPPESFDNWQHLYFDPADLADSAVTGPPADPDGDGIVNLLEFAFNLDPSYNERALMTPVTGLRGLPLIRWEQIAANDHRLTVEFVRRTAASGSGITYAVQFASSLDSAGTGWATGGTEKVTPINARWDRVKVTDTLMGTPGSARFARVLVTPTSQPAAPAETRTPLQMRKHRLRARRLKALDPAP